MYGYDPGGLQESDAQDAADAADYLNLQKNVAARNAPTLPDTQPPPFDPYATPPNVGAPPAIAAPTDSAAAPPPGLPSAPPAGTDGTTPQGGPLAETPMPPAATAQNPSVAAPQPLADLGPPPARPKLTGDPTKDNQANLEWSQQLGDYQVTLAKRQGELAKHADTVAADKAKREAEEERRVASVRQAEATEFQARQQARQQQIDDAVKEKQAAYTDLKNPSGTSFADRLGAAIAIALGGIGQGLMLKGHVAGAQNEGLNAVNKNIEQDHQRKLERLKSASDSIMEARYGFKDAADNHRAALNDLDADRAAKYRLIASEAEEQLRAQGVKDADIKTNAVVLNALQEAAKSTDTITAREEAEGVKRQTAAASAAASAARFDQGERQIKATADQRRDTAYEHRREFDLKDKEARDRAAAAAAAKADKQKDADEKEIVRDENNKPIGRVPSGRGGAAQFATRDSDYARADEQLSALLKDIKDNGERPLTPSAARRRQTLEENATIGVATVSPLGKTNEAMQAEGASIGAHGQGIVAAIKGATLGSNPEAIERKLHEVRGHRDRYRQETLRPLGDDGVPAAHTAEKPQTDAEQAREHLGKSKPKATTGDMVTIRNAKTGETKRVTRAEAQALGAL